MRHSLLVLLFIIAPVAAMASGGHDAKLHSAHVDLRDKPSLQRGAKYFVNYCMGCHSLKYMRYNRLAEDLNISEQELRDNLIFGDAQPGDLMTIALRPEDGEQWFGTVVPDLTLVTRWRSPDWVYSYLKSFYVDDNRPYGVNNLLYPDVGMPHVLAELQGVQEAIYGHGHEGQVTGLKLTQPGELTPEQYDHMVHDLTNFLTYVGEPIQLERRRLGTYVLLFLGLMFVLTYMLKKEYWKDVH